MIPAVPPMSMQPLKRLPNQVNSSDGESGSRAPEPLRRLAVYVGAGQADVGQQPTIQAGQLAPPQSRSRQSPRRWNAARSAPTMRVGS
jgi:hypothetical protein